MLLFISFKIGGKVVEKEKKSIIKSDPEHAPKIKAFPHAREFYNSQAKAVVNFCKSGKIEYHIKEGTVS